MVRPTVQAFTLSLSLAVLTGACASGGAKSSAPAPELSAAPLSFSLADVQGEQVAFEQFRGKPAIIDFWASWCEPCKAAMPFFDELHAKYGQQVAIIGVSVDEDPGAMKGALKDRPVHFLILNDPKGTLAQRLDVATMPSTYLVDRKGIVRVVHRGFVDSDRAAIEEELTKLLAEPAGP